MEHAQEADHADESDHALTADSATNATNATNAQNAANAENAEVAEGLTDAVISALMLKMYPVGAIYASTVSTNPGTLFGGTWEALPAGRVLLAQGTSSWGTTYAAGSQGGEATHTLTIGEMPSHNHAPVNTSLRFTLNQPTSSDSVARRDNLGDIDSITECSTTSNTGSGSPHSLMQPYISVYFWKRVS